MLRLFTDTDCDITPSMAKEMGLSLISMPYAIDGKNIEPYVDFETFDAHAFYDVLRGGVLPTTSAVSEERYIEYFEPVFATGDDIFYIHFSAAMSMTFGNMEKAVARLQQKYPERKFWHIDTRGISALSALIVMEVADMVREGKTPDEIVAWSESNLDHYAMYFLADDLKFFKRSGRVSGLAATMGTLIGVRPIIFMNDEGKMVSCGKERGRQKAIDHIVNKVVELGDDVKNHRIILSHTDAYDFLDDMVNGLKEKLGDDINLIILDCNPTAGSHCGPNGIGMAFHAIHK